MYRRSRNNERVILKMSTSPRQRVSEDMADTEVTGDSGDLRTGFRFFSKGGNPAQDVPDHSLCQSETFLMGMRPQQGIK